MKVKAFQMTKDKFESSRDWPNWLVEDWNRKFCTVNVMQYNPIQNRMCDAALLGLRVRGEEVVIKENDWIVQATNGNLFICDSDMYNERYANIDREVKCEI
jgi:hypothetical protein